MGTVTPNYNLYKPIASDTEDVNNDFNDNYETIASKLTSLQSRLTAPSVAIQDVCLMAPPPATNYTTLQPYTGLEFTAKAGVKYFVNLTTGCDKSGAVIQMFFVIPGTYGGTAFTGMGHIRRWDYGSTPTGVASTGTKASRLEMSANPFASVVLMGGSSEPDSRTMVDITGIMESSINTRIIIVAAYQSGVAAGSSQLYPLLSGSRLKAVPIG